jgi:hypothetical protein
MMLLAALAVAFGIAFGVTFLGGVLLGVAAGLNYSKTDPLWGKRSTAFRTPDHPGEAR